jgi:hypothetical protein
MASPALQRTVRRVVAVLLLQLGAISAQLYELEPGGSEGSVATYITIPLFAGALVYLRWSFGYGVVRGLNSDAAAT